MDFPFNPPSVSANPPQFNTWWGGWVPTLPPELKLDVYVHHVPPPCGHSRPAPPVNVSIRMQKRKEAKMDVAVVLPDNWFANGHITPSANDVDGKPYTNADGTLLDPATLPIEYSSTDENVAKGSADPAGSSSQDYRIDTVAPGICGVVAKIGPYPNGMFAELKFGVTVTFSEPGAAVATVNTQPE